MQNYIPVLVALLVAAGVAIGMLVLSHLLSERRLMRPKLMPYECGVDPVGDARQRFPVKFYVIAMLFILFDIEIVFLYPWAVVWRESGLKALCIGEMVVFLAILIVGYIYLLRTGAFEWEWWERTEAEEAEAEAESVTTDTEASEVTTHAA